MRFEGLKQRVERRETLVQGRIKQVRQHAGEFERHWREGLTPPRILIAGLVAGFVAGHSQPAKSLRRVAQLGNPRWIQLITALSGLGASLQAAFAAATANDAADKAGVAANKAERKVDEATATPPSSSDGAARDPATPRVEAPTATAPTDRRRRPDPVWSAAPSPAEAATDVSEQR